MTQVFETDGTVVPATVIKAGPCVVVQAKSAQTDGYEAVQLGLVDEKPTKENKPTAGHYKKANVPPTRIRREVKVAAGTDAPKAGDQVLASIFTSGDRVTTRNLKVVRVDTDNHLIVLRGAVPGAPGGVVMVRRAVARKPDPQPQVEKKKGKK